MGEILQFKDLKTKEEFMEFFCVANAEENPRFLRHTNYYHYTKEEKFLCIIKSKKLWLTSYAKREYDNDITESEWYKNYGQNLFSICFTSGTSESLPFWYLYSGVQGKGVRLQFSRRSLKELYNNGKYIIVYKTKESELLRKDQYTVVGGDILYIDADEENKEKCRAKYQNTNCFGINKTVVDALKEKDNYGAFIKDLIWSYEKETRIQVAIIDESIEPESVDHIELDISEVIKSMELRLGPEYDRESKEKLLERKEVNEWLSSKVEDSLYLGKIRMNLCNNCTYIQQKTDDKAHDREVLK